MSESPSSQQRVDLRTDSTRTELPDEIVSQLPAGTDEKTVVSSRPPIPVPGQAVLGQGDSMRRFELGQFHPGDRLDHFELVEFVGGGGMGRVFKARDLRLDRIVALKVIPRELASDSETLQRFLNEAKSAALLDHENIVRVFHIGEDNGMFFLVFEFVEGRTIRDLVQQRGRLPLTEAIHYAIQVADAVAHLAEAGVVHRDIKPSNILVDPHGRVKVIDLGLARIYHTAANDDLTATGVTLGTFDYISPEQARDPRSVDARSDIYSLGCTLFYMLSGRPPFPEGTVLQKLLKHQGDTPPDIREFRPELPEEISLVMRKMMAKDPNRRFRNATLLLEQLLVVAEHIGLRTDHYRVWAVPSRGEYSFLQRHLPWVVPTILLFAVGAGLSVFWSPSSLDDPASGGAVSESPNRPLVPRTTIPGEHDVTTAKESSVGIPANGNPPGKAATAPRPPNVTPELPTPNGKGNDGSPAVNEADSATSAESKPAAAETMLATVAVDPLAPATPGIYRSVSEALRRAPKATTVELRFNGRAKETSWDLSGRDVRVVAAADCRPILSFAPESPAPARSEAVIRVRGGSLTVADVSVELLVPRSDAVERWTMIELANGPEVNITGSTLTIRNAVDRGVPYHENVAFFRAAETEDRSADPSMDADSTASAEAFVELSDVVVRGEASLLGVNSPVSVSLLWNNGLLVSNRPAILTRDVPPHSSRVKVDVEWWHVTAILDAGLWSMIDSKERSGRVPLTVTTTDCIVATSTARPLIEQTDGKDLDELHRLLNWYGERNFYQGFQTFWSVRHAGSVDPVETWDFEQWKTYWGPEQENLANLDRVVWKKPFPTNLPFNEHTPRDYALNNDPGVNPAAAAATDRHDVGAVLDALPEPPPALTSPGRVQ